MSRNTSQKRGLALGAVFALVASIFSSAPAQASSATDGANIAIRPVVGTTFGGMVYSDFDVYAQLLPGQSNTNFAGSLKWRINVTSGFGMDVVYQSSGSAVTATATANSGSANVGVIGAGTAATSASFAASVSSGVSYMSFKAHSTSAEATSWSSVTVTLTAWIDEVTIGDGVSSGTGVIDAAEWRTTQTMTLYNMSDLPVTANWTAPNSADAFVTASATITGVNFANLGDGKFFLAVSSSQAIFSGSASQESSSPLAGATLANRSGVLSSSWAVSSINEFSSVSFQVRYDKTGTGGTYTAGVGKTATAYAAVAPGVDTLSISATANANITGGGVAYTVRPNQTYTIRVTAATGSTSVSKAVTVTLGGTGLVTSSKLLSINGGAFVTAYPAAGITVTTGTNGVGTFTLGTSGFVDGDTLTIDANVGNISPALVTLTVANPTYTVVADQNLVATAPGTAVNLGFTVEDQWGELSAATNQFLKVTRGGSGFNYATTVSYHAVAAGVATVAFTPEPAAKTGSATVTVDITKLENGAYIANGTSDSVTVTVTSTANSFTTGLAASRAASVSYFPSTVSWVTVTGKVAVTGSAVTITGDSTMVFRQSAALSTTTSGTISVYSNASAEYSFQVAALRSGSKTMTLTNGTATTTSLLVVAAAASDMGSAIAWDTTTIEAGKTRVITGTLTDANGNAVDTTGVGRTAGDSGTASLVISYTGTAGIVVGTMPTETDADGKFKVSVLTAAADNGTLTLTAVYMPQGASTATGDKVTSVQAVSVAAAAAPEVNAVIGSFNGRWAVRVENAKGSVVSVKVGGNWFKFNSLNNNYLFSRKSVVGRTIAVSVWVDGELQNSQTITVR